MSGAALAGRRARALATLQPGTAPARRARWVAGVREMRGVLARAEAAGFPRERQEVGGFELAAPGHAAGAAARARRS